MGSGSASCSIEKQHAQRIEGKRMMSVIRFKRAKEGLDYSVNWHEKVWGKGAIKLQRTAEDVSRGGQTERKAKMRGKS